MSATYTQAVADAVRQAMESADLTTNALSEAAHIPYQTLKRRLSGVGPFDVDELARIATALHVTVEDLIAQTDVAS